MTQPATHRQPPVLAAAVLIPLAVVVLQALLVPLFAGPASHLAPRDLPVVVAGPPPVTAALAERLRAAEPGAFRVTAVPDEASADRALRNREAYAAFVPGADGVSLHTASAASPTVAALLTAAAQQLSQGAQVKTVDVVPTDPDDRLGAGFAAGFLPLAITGLLTGFLIAVVLRRRGPRLLGLAVFGVLAGLVGAAVLQYWLGVLPGTYLANAAAVGLVALAIAAAIAGLGVALGRAGLGLGAALVFLVGNALSGIPAAPELLPQPWGAVGQWLPIGSGGTLLRSVAYFDGARSAGPLWVLGTWAVVGVALVLVRRGGVPPQAAEPAVVADQPSPVPAQQVA